eukprot:TRINITY_DN35418_c0_g1_i1.p1 TRINITY_DN35418_c0_g1~~TRINITY_DN35418_c0_g1_i1.p1  ORF type:complete len:602 (+),score=111.13 TRINITY_DN35418_c0_g1_i1:175-1980(+)
MRLAADAVHAADTGTAKVGDNAGAEGTPASGGHASDATATIGSVGTSGDGGVGSSVALSVLPGGASKDVRNSTGGVQKPTASGLPRLCVVEIPGRVENASNAVAAIGGFDAVKAAVASREVRLKLRLAQQFRYQAPLPLKRKLTSDLLVKAVRKRDGTWDCKPVGIVIVSFSADALADYIFAPGEELVHGASTVIGSIEEELSNPVAPGPIYIPPPFFTRVDTPQPYNFEENAFLRRYRRQKVSEVAGTGETRLERFWVSVCVHRFRDSRVPQEPPDGALAQVRSDDDKKLVSALRVLFQERPMWLRSPLEEELPPRVRSTANISSMQRCLLVVAYFWSDGPFRGTYARLGWDPREHPQVAKELQVIDFRDRHLRQRKVYFQALQGNVASEPVPSDCHFRTPPTNRSQLYQFIDIEDEGVQQLLTAAEPLSRCCAQTGWLSADSLRALRNRMAVKAALMRRVRSANQALEGPAATSAALATRTREALRAKWKASLKEKLRKAAKVGRRLSQRNSAENKRGGAPRKSSGGGKAADDAESLRGTADSTVPAGNSTVAMSLPADGSVTTAVGGELPTKRLRRLIPVTQVPPTCAQGPVLAPQPT